jgi:endogenous inhibitor of DNA gyrase (YacG/DUF329 family)
MKAEAKKTRMVNCPRCGTATPWSEANAFRPFCSERCKLIDLGLWATEGYRIPQEEADAGKSEGEER